MLGIYNMYEETIKLFSSRTFIVDDKQYFSYAEMGRLTNRLAYGLHCSGIKEGSNVGYLMMNGYRTVMCFFALQKLGAFMTPFNFRFHVKEIDTYISKMDCEYFIYGSEFNDIIAEVRPNHPDVTWIAVDDEAADLHWDSLLDNKKENWEYCPDLPGDSPAMAILTGGSTGCSKAAVHTRFSLVMNYLSLEGWIYTREPVHKPKTFLMTSPLFHVGGISPMLNVVCFGGTLVFLGQFSIENIAAMIQREKVTDLMLIPPNLAQSIKNVGIDKNYDLSSVEYVGFGGGAASAAHVGIVFDVFPNAVCELTYSQSEGASYLSNYLTKQSLIDNPQRALATGKPVYFCDMKLIKEDGSEAGIGEIGELYGRCACMMQEYYKQENSPFINGWLPTGDLFRRDEDNYYYFADRKKDMIKSGGENVFSAEVEAVIKLMPQVSEVAVVGMPDRFFGEAVSAAIVVKPGYTLSSKEVTDYCKSHIASYKKPRNIYFMPSLPKTPIGKVHKITLKELLIGRKSD